MNWRAYAIRVLLGDGLRWYARSGRTPTAAQYTCFALVAALLAGCAMGAEVVWLLTGRARRMRHALGWDGALVVLGPKGIPPELRERLDAVAARGRKEFERMQAEMERKRAERSG